MKLKQLSFQFKLWGYVLIGIGIVFLILYSNSSLRIESPVFAIYSGFLEHKFFAISHTNLTDELALFFFLTGLMLVILSKERFESESIKKIRYKALLLSFLINYIMLIFCTLFIFGSGFIFIVILNLCSQSVIFIICFTILKRNYRKHLQ